MPRQPASRGALRRRPPCTRRQSRPSNNAPNWAAVRRITPSCIPAHLKPPCLRRLASKHSPVPSHQIILMRSALLEDQRAPHCSCRRLLCQRRPQPRGATCKSEMSGCRSAKAQRLSHPSASDKIASFCSVLHGRRRPVTPEKISIRPNGLGLDPVHVSSAVLSAKSEIRATSRPLRTLARWPKTSKHRSPSA
jgi:hypothetical protein